MNMKFLVALIAGLTTTGSLAQQPPNGPVADILSRLGTLEQKVSALGGVGGGSHYLVDSGGRVLGPVLASTYQDALVEVSLRGTKWKVALGDGTISTDGPSYSIYFFVSSDCAGQAYSRAARYDGSWRFGIWGTGFLPSDRADEKLKLPKIGAVPETIAAQSYRHHPDGRCSAYAETLLAFRVDDLEVVDPFAGFTPPFEIRTAP